MHIEVKEPFNPVACHFIQKKNIKKSMHMIVTFINILSLTLIFTK